MKNLIVNIAVLTSSFDRACRISVIVFFIVYFSPFETWSFPKLFTITYALALIQTLIIVAVHKSRLEKELEDMFDKNEEEKK